MYGTLTYPKFFRRLPYSRFGVDDIMSDLYSPLFNIIFQKHPLNELFLQSMHSLRELEGHSVRHPLEMRGQPFLQFREKTSLNLPKPVDSQIFLYYNEPV